MHSQPDASGHALFQRDKCPAGTTQEADAAGNVVLRLRSRAGLGRFHLLLTGGQIAQAFQFDPQMLRLKG